VDREDAKKRQVEIHASGKKEGGRQERKSKDRH
jgi:hypothetical protein